MFPFTNFTISTLLSKGWKLFLLASGFICVNQVVEVTPWAKKLVERAYPSSYKKRCNLLTAIENAVKNGNDNQLNSLIDDQSSAHIKHTLVRKAFISAATFGNIDLVRKMFETHWNFVIQDIHLAILFAQKGGHRDIVNYLEYQRNSVNRCLQGQYSATCHNEESPFVY